MAGRHSGGFGVPALLRTPLAIAAMLSLALVAGVALWTVVNRAGGCDGEARLTVAAAPDIAPAIRAAADRWMAGEPRVGDDCVTIEVRAAEPADVAALLAERAGGQIDVAAPPAPSGQVPAAWIPDSTAWIDRLRAVRRDILDPDTPSIAMSPIVFGMSEPLARSILGGRARITGPDVAPLLAKPGTTQLRVIEPRRDTAGLAGAIFLHDLIVTDPRRLTEMVRAYRSVDVAPDAGELRRTITAAQLAPMSEQAVLAYDATTATVPLLAVPIEPAASLDFPYAVVSGRSRPVTRAARLFLSALRSPEYGEILARSGFRDPDGVPGAGFPVGFGATTEPATPRPLADAAKVAEILGYWTTANTASRVLALVDATSSMNQPVRPGGGASRLAVLREAATDGLKLFTDDSEAGLWAFAAGGAGQPDYRELVPLDTLGAAQRARLTAAVAGATAGPANVSGLYGAVLAAYKRLKTGYREGHSNTVVVFTDGANTKPGMSLDALKVELEKLTDPTRPIRVVLLGIGPDINRGELQQIATTTGGRSFAVEDPDQIGNIFLQALLRG